MLHGLSSAAALSVPTTVGGSHNPSSNGSTAGSSSGKSTASSSAASGGSSSSSFHLQSGRASLACLWLHRSCIYAGNVRGRAAANAEAEEWDEAQGKQAAGGASEQKGAGSGSSGSAGRASDTLSGAAAVARVCGDRRPQAGALLGCIDA